ncbi:hypothetical protein PMAYCL1PPCAC_12688, partial [Pristionchus mayeri]
ISLLMDFGTNDLPLSENELPDIAQVSTSLRLISNCSIGRKKPKSAGGPNGEDGVDGEFFIENVIDVQWNELALAFTVKWLGYPSEDNTTENLSSIVSLQAPYKYLTEINVNDESECFKIYAGLHKPGFRFYTSDDRFFFCVKKADFLSRKIYNPYRRVFNSVEHRDELLRKYNSRLRKLPERFLYKVVNEEDLAIPPPFFQIDILDHDDDDLPSLNRDVRGEMTILRNQSSWCLRADHTLVEGSSLFEIEGKNICSEVAYEHMKEMGELSCISHFIYLGEQENNHRSIDRREVFDAVSCISHSCDPNCKMVWNGDTVEVVTRKRITKGEEITLDYFSGNTLKKTKMELMDRLAESMDCIECTCLSNNCRIILWTEDLVDPIYYEYPKEDKLEHVVEWAESWTNGNFYKGVCFNKI